MARRSKEERKKAIDESWAGQVPPLGIPGSSIFLAVKLAKLMIDHEENMGFAPDLRQLAAAEQRLMEQIPQAPDSPLVRTEVVDQKPRKKRKVSDYSKQFGIILKALKKKHPRTPVTRLMKRAHTATKKKMPKKKAVPKGRLSKGRRTIAKSGQFRRDKLLPRFKD